MTKKFPHLIQLNEKWNPSWQSWCSTNIGQMYELWCCKGSYNHPYNGIKHYNFWFKNKNDALLFKMVWI